jgi:hypothetical protein
MMKTKEKGFVLPMAMLMVVFFSILLLGLLPMTTAQLRFTKFDSDRVCAQYAAEAGAKSAVRSIQLNFNKINGILDAGNIGDFDLNSYSTNFVNDKSSYTVEYHPDNMNPSATSQINIISTGHCNNRKYTVKIIYALSNSNLYVASADGIVQYFQGAQYSHLNGTGTEQTWNFIDPVTDNAHPENNKPATVSPPGTGNYQVLFKGQQFEENFKLAYNCACKNFPNDSSGKGYGIYYGATGDPDNLTSYVFQYDPGASEGGNGGAFFVKKVKTAPNIPGFIGDLEWDDNKVVQKYVAAHWEGWGWKKTWVPEQPEILGGYYNTHYEQGDNFTTPCHKPFQPNEGSCAPGQDGTIKISLNELKSYMESQPGITTPFNLNASHKITIEVKDDPNGQKRHLIFCDGVLILSFVDKTTRCPIDFTQPTYTGLRVWNADVGFYNNPHEMYGQKGKAAIIWTK